MCDSGGYSGLPYITKFTGEWNPSVYSLDGTFCQQFLNASQIQGGLVYFSMTVRRDMFQKRSEIFWEAKMKKQ